MTHMVIYTFAHNRSELSSVKVSALLQAEAQLAQRVSSSTFQISSWENLLRTVYTSLSKLLNIMLFGVQCKCNI